MSLKAPTGVTNTASGEDACRKPKRSLFVNPGPDDLEYLADLFRATGASFGEVSENDAAQILPDASGLKRKKVLRALRDGPINYISTASSSATINAEDVRIDYNLSDRDRLFVVHWCPVKYFADSSKSMAGKRIVGVHPKNDLN